ncbi:hypothetical protein BP6252_07925 [Coleophoma cylindrospora]|uniref:Uncharacterized protein n=1 Tax=Coleophoma cylindrospora TaxID=1849047 RepID=A0A3D8RBE8_9HELO|nr:hypothetical protein BP6252_07925 [Coleophoma cylindrospora]
MRKLASASIAAAAGRSPDDRRAKGSPSQVSLSDAERGSGGGGDGEEMGRRRQSQGSKMIDDSRAEFSSRRACGVGIPACRFRIMPSVASNVAGADRSGWVQVAWDSLTTAAPPPTAAAARTWSTAPHRSMMHLPFILPPAKTT